jgi:transposase-like protein
MEIFIIVAIALGIAILFLNNKRKKCPFCKSDNVSEKFLGTSSHTYCRRCNNCGKQFMA